MTKTTIEIGQKVYLRCSPCHGQIHWAGTVEKIDELGILVHWTDTPMGHAEQRHYSREVLTEKPV